jgi:hypothetical protein
MFFCIDEVVVELDDIPLATESAEMGSWAECKGLYTEPAQFYSGSLNISPSTGEANKLGGPQRTKKAL